MHVKPRVSATLLGAADAIRERVPEPRVPADARYMAERGGIARAAVTDAEFEASYERGRTLSADAAFAIVETMALVDGV
jgi:hypothetical protein